MEISENMGPYAVRGLCWSSGMTPISSGVRVHVWSAEVGQYG